jgi:thiol:disulfide interchange protein DsbA
MFKGWFMGLAALMLLSGSALAQSAFVEGTDYQTISPAVKTSQPDKVVVTEVFWYGCPHCFRFEPFVERWSASLPDGVVFEQLPSALNPRWVEHARAYYAFKMMNAHDQTHKALFDAIHLKRQRITDLDSLAEFAVEQGLDEKLFRETYSTKSCFAKPIFRFRLKPRSVKICSRRSAMAIVECPRSL